MSPVFFLFLGFVLLFFGGELLVKGSVLLALRMKVSTLVVGMTVVAFATSAPELFVSLKAVFNGSSNIALGNIIGSNIANIALVLALTAIIFRVKISKQTLFLNYPIMLGSSLLFGLVLYFFNGIPSVIGFFFVILLLVFIWSLITISRSKYFELEDTQEIVLEHSKDNSLISTIIILIFGGIMLKYGAEFLVDSTIVLAEKFGISDRIIAVTLVAIGTSVPELATSIIAALKKEENLAVGNLLGSNIFNILAVLGITASISEINISDADILSIDYFWMMLITFLFGLIIYVFSKQKISRTEGLLLLSIYIYYIYITFI